MKKLMALMALTILTACDYAERLDLRNERSESLYRAAMEDYRCGRLDAAIEGFEKTLRKNPGNAGARFQLACLRQDVKGDFLAAFCDYREYLRLRPESDKASIAKDRLALCEREMAKSLAKRHGLLTADGFAKELEAAEKKLAAAERRVAEAEKKLDAEHIRAEALVAERSRLLAIVRGTGEADETLVAGDRPSKEAKELLEEEAEETDRSEIASDVAALRKEETDEMSSSSSLLPEQPAGAKDARKAAEAAKRAAEKKPEEPPHPETYKIAEGDTLYGIAKKFYGRTSAWKKIRDANKDLISMDNRLRAGDTIKLP